MSRKREHGRIISVESKTRGDALAENAAAGATSITVDDAGDFDEDGGWLTIGGQVIEFSECDDDTGVILLVDPLTAAAEQGDPVQVWSDLYEEVIDYQQALVELDGEYDNPDPVVAEVAEGVGELPEGDRGRAGESCTLKRVSDDEWEVVAVGGRSKKSQRTRWEQDDFYVLTAADIIAGSATMPLSHRPNDEALTCVFEGVPQRPTEWTIDYDAQTLTIPLDGWERSDDVLWVHYAYRKGVATPTVVDSPVFRAASGGTTTDPVMPAGTQPGDLMVLFAVMNTMHSVTSLNGWAEAGSSAAVTWDSGTWGPTNYLVRVFWKVAATADDPRPVIDNAPTPTFVQTHLLVLSGVSTVDAAAFNTKDVAASSHAAPPLAGGQISFVNALRTTSGGTIELQPPDGSIVYWHTDFYRPGLSMTASTDPVECVLGGTATPADVDWLGATVRLGG